MTIWNNRDELVMAIADWKRAYRAASSGKSYTIGSRTLTRYDIDDIRAQLDYLQGELDALDGRPSGIRRFRMRSVR